VSKSRLETLISLPPYSGYLYAYPHKTAYRAFNPELNFKDVWKAESLESLFLYFHIPFCEMRCGFCNLFTMTGAKKTTVQAYLEAIRREVETVKSSLPHANFSEVAIGGGTPTFLSAEQLDELLDLSKILAQEDRPISIESSPSRTTVERLHVLERRNVSRISLGVESFSSDNLRAMGRPAHAEDAIKALDNIRTYTHADLNIDLIYGAQGQSVAGFATDIKRALEWSPEEIFIYPLYVGPLTGLSKRGHAQNDWDAHRLAQYRAGRELLLNMGYHQSSLRRFVKTKSNMSKHYSCQEDGMIGIGAGARSYTRNVHYSSDYAVKRQAIQGIIDNYTAREDFTRIGHGIRLSSQEQKRRYVIKSILNHEGLDLEAYEARFGRSAFLELPDLHILIDADYLNQSATHLTPTPLGLERSDAMGSFLISTNIEKSMKAYAWA